MGGEGLPENANSVFRRFYTQKSKDKQLPARSATAWGLSLHAAKVNLEGASKYERQQKT